MLGASRLAYLAKTAEAGLPAHTLSGISFDDNEHYYYDDFDATGTTANKEITVSFWFKANQSFNRAALFSVRPSGRLIAFWAYQDGDAKARIYIQTPNLTYNGYSTETTLYTTSDGWHHFVFSCDFSTAGTSHAYFDGTEITMTSNSVFSENIEWNDNAIGLTSNGRPSDDREMELAQLFVDNKYYDLDSNIDKFYDSTNSAPVDLGSDGTNTGLTQPLIYHDGDTTGYPTNKGTWSYTYSSVGTPENSSVGPGE